MQLSYSWIRLELRSALHCLKSDAVGGRDDAGWLPFSSRGIYRVFTHSHLPDLNAYCWAFIICLFLWLELLALCVPFGTNTSQ